MSVNKLVPSSAIKIIRDFREFNNTKPVRSRRAIKIAKNTINCYHSINGFYELYGLENSTGQKINACNAVTAMFYYLYQESQNLELDFIKWTLDINIGIYRRCLPFMY